MLATLLARAATGSRAPHPDGRRIALAIEGGAMRGVVSAGMVSALEELGLTHAFDAVYGSSAGALNGAYFLAGQARLGTSIYYEDINNRHFIDPWRPLTGRPIVDLGYLIDDVVRRRKVLDTAAVLAAPSPLTVMATDVAAASRATIRGLRDPESLLQALRAGATMPVVAGLPVRVDGRDYLDASLTEPIPVPMAETDGFTDIVVLLTRPRETVRALSPLDRFYVMPRLQRISPELARRYAERGAGYAALGAQIDAGRGPGGHARVMGLRPDGEEVSKLERDAGRLRAAAARGEEAVIRAFRGAESAATIRSAS